MSAGERFDDAELAAIAAEFGCDEFGQFYGLHLRGFPPVGYIHCGSCHRAVPERDRDGEASGHAPGCAGVARRRIAAKARRMQAGVGGGA